MNDFCWLPTRICDLFAFETVDPDIYCTDSLTIHFSDIVFNQAHEQYNVVVYRAISLTKDTVAHRRWILAGPEFRGFIV